VGRDDAGTGFGFRACQSYPEKSRFVKCHNGLRALIDPRFNLSFARDEPAYLAVVQYDGAEFAGWQRQPDGRTVQAEFEAVLERLMGRRTAATGAGRTDTGVHALGRASGFWRTGVGGTTSPGCTGPSMPCLPRDIWVEARQPDAAGVSRPQQRAGTPLPLRDRDRRRGPLAVPAAVRMGPWDARSMSRCSGPRRCALGGARLPRPRRDRRGLGTPHYRSRVALAQWAPRTDGAG